jgi:nitroreductase
VGVHHLPRRCALRELATLGAWAGHLAGAPVAIALVTPDPRAEGAPLSIIFDLGRAAQNIVLAAWELGIGSAPATVYEHERAADLLGLPDGMHCEYLISFGYPADEAVLTAPKRAGGRRPLAEMVHLERWQPVTASGRLALRSQPGGRRAGSR